MGEATTSDVLSHGFSNWTVFIAFIKLVPECLEKFMASIKVEHVFKCVLNGGDIGIFNDSFSTQVQ